EDEPFRRYLTRCDLTPSARRRAEIEDARAGPEQMETALDLVELERGARAKALVLRLPVEAVARVVRLGHGYFYSDRHGESAGDCSRRSSCRVRPRVLERRAAGGVLHDPVLHDRARAGLLR